MTEQTNNNKDENPEPSEELANQEYFDRSGCRSIMITLLIIFLFWVVVGIKMFT